MPRLSAAELSDHLASETPATAGLVRALRRAVLAAAPHAAESIKFHVLCYYRPDAYFGAIGGNICMIETKHTNARQRVLLTFIHGSHLDDPDRLLQGKQKFKRHVEIPDAAFAQSRQVAALVRAAAKLRMWD